MLKFKYLGGMPNIPGILGGNLSVRIYLGTYYIVDAGALPTVHSEIFARFFFSRIAFKRHSCGVKKSRLGHVLPSSVKDRVILLFRVGFIFTKLRIYICEVSQK